MNTHHYIIIQAKYICPTNFNGSRVGLSLPRWDNKKIIRSWDDALSGLENQAAEILRSAGITPAGFGETKEGYSFFVPFDQVEAVRSLFCVK